ncbi:MAG TPA: carbohydrate kinase [Gaiellaceae bacterium]|nr:carbohydrate kinase [Gaiellaceae bacterium]
MIVVAGEALLDLVVSDGAVLPSPGGGPYNTARALGRLGASVGFLGRLSQDYFGSMLTNVLAESGVSLRYASRGPEPSALAIAHRTADGEADYSFYLGGTTFGYATFAPPGADVRALCVGSLALALDPPASALEALVEKERQKRIVVIDPNVRAEAIAEHEGYRERFDRCCRAAHIVKLSASDASWLLPGIGPGEVATRLVDLGAELVVVTLGADGAIARSQRAGGRVPTQRVDVADTIGAGDAFGAGLLVALEQRGALVPGSLAALGESELQEVLHFASAVAALTCARSGAETPTLSEVAELLDRA